MSWQSAIELEHEVAKYHAQQVLNGVLFDVEAAEKLKEHLVEEIEVVTNRLLKTIPSFYYPKTGGPKTAQAKATVNKPFMKAGGLSQKAANWHRGEDIVGPFCMVEYLPLNLDSDKEVKEYLLTQGWIPTEYNYSKTKKDSNGKPLRTSPKLTEDSFPSIKGAIGQDIARRNMLQHREGMVGRINKKGEPVGFLHNIREDGRIEADAITLGAATGRYAHIGVANLPRVSTEYGKEIRSLFTVPEDKVMVGWDLAGIENRIAGHYLAAYDKGAFAKEVLEGDFHQTTADAFGISRDEAKTLRYMILYGAQPKKISASMGWSLSKARRVFKDFWKKEKHLGRMNQRLIQAAKRGWINGLDGRKLFPRSQHAMLNFLFQSAATIVFKRAIVILNEKLIATGIEYKQLIAYHDEGQMEANEKDVEVITAMIHESVREAGEFYNLRLPIEADVKVGRNWAETH